MNRPKFFPRIDPIRGLSTLMVVAALAVTVVASIRAANRTTDVASEAPKVPSPERSGLGSTPIPGRGALPLCPTSRFAPRPVDEVDATPKIEVDSSKEGAGPVEGPPPKGRL